jgi:hypothetical protein
MKIILLKVFLTTLKRKKNNQTNKKSEERKTNKQINKITIGQGNFEIVHETVITFISGYI